MGRIASAGGIPRSPRVYSPGLGLLEQFQHVAAAVANQLMAVACVEDDDGFEIDWLAAALTCRFLLSGHARVIGTEARALQPRPPV